MVLIVSNSHDAHVPIVTGVLAARGVEHVRLDTDRFADDVSFEILPLGGTLRLGRRELDLAEVGAVWWRRPVPPIVHYEGDVALTRWASDQAHAGLDAALRSLDARFINHPDVNRGAEDKVAVMRSASAVGLSVPSWTVTNDVAAAGEFVRGEAKAFVIKPIRGGRIDAKRSFYTTRVESLAKLPTIGPEPYISQSLIEKAHDIPVVVIQRRCFAIQIASQADPRAAIDVRAGNLRALEHRVVDLPARLESRLLRLCAQYSLRFATIDLIRDHRGGYWFLEVNPNGQWGWLQEMTEAPLAETLAEALTG